MSNPKLHHHKPYEHCRTRPEYRRCKIPTAVKVYTIANESNHLLIFGVPRINLSRELKQKLVQFGIVRSIECVTDKIEKEPHFALEAFTDCFHCVFEKLQNARRCKKMIDTNVFYGGILHVSYAPECDTIDELSEKLLQRKKEVLFRNKLNKRDAE